MTSLHRAILKALIIEALAAVLIIALVEGSYILAAVAAVAFMLEVAA